MSTMSKPKMRLRCRRGMLELDVMLTHFIDKCYDTLSEEELRDFARLLEYSDTSLLSWLLRSQQPDSAHLVHIVDKIIVAYHHSDVV